MAIAGHVAEKVKEGRKPWHLTSKEHFHINIVKTAVNLICGFLINTNINLYKKFKELFFFLLSSHKINASYFK